MHCRRQQLLKGAATTLVVVCVALWLLLVTGCASTGRGGAVWWNPTTWLARAAPAAADRAGEKRDQASERVDQREQQAIHAAHVEVAKADLALAAAPASRPVDVARRTTGNALGLLAQVQPLTAAESQEIRQLVTDLLSEKAEIVAQAERRQREVEGANAQLSRDLETARRALEQREAALVAANANLRTAYDRENALANQVRNFWFVVIGLAILWLGGNVLAVGARFVPALAPISAAVNGIAAPALAFAEARARDGLQKVGYAMARVRTAVPEAAERIVELFDQETDRDHQRLIGSAANHAPRS